MERTEQLKQLSDYLREYQSSGKPARLIFICTHNSRRSRMSQLWAAVAAVHYGFEKAVQNPKYHLSFAHNSKPQACFSKVYSEGANPIADFCAVMTCSSADKSCPSVKGAIKRVAIPYEGPKIAKRLPPGCNSIIFDTSGFRNTVPWMSTERSKANQTVVILFQPVVDRS